MSDNRLHSENSLASWYVICILYTPLSVSIDNVQPEWFGGDLSRLVNRFYATTDMPTPATAGFDWSLLVGQGIIKLGVHLGLDKTAHSSDSTIFW